MKNICKKTITFSIILLLIGVSVSSAISIDTKSTISNNESVEDCNCKEVDSRHLVRLERQLNRLEVYSRLLLVLSKHNPELRELNEELSNEITTLKEELADDLSSRPICDIIGNIISTFISIHFKIYELVLKFEYKSIGWRIFVFIDSLYLTLVAPIWYPLLIIYSILDCWEPYHTPHLIS